MTHLTNKNLKNKKALTTLKKFNIRHIEQLGALLLSPVGKQALLYLLEDTISISELEDSIRGELESVELPGLRLGASEEVKKQRLSISWHDRGYGLLQSNSDISTELFDIRPSISMYKGGTNSSKDRFKSEIDQFASFNTSKESSFYIEESKNDIPKDQGHRGTCVAFACLSVLQLFLANHVKSFEGSDDFSEQYLYLNAKKEGSNINEEGTTIEAALTTLSEKGVCESSVLAYRDYNDWAHSLLFSSSKIPLKELHARAEKMKVKTYMHLPGLDLVQEIKECINRALPVVAGVQVFQDSWNLDYTIWKGEVQLPLKVKSEDGNDMLLDTGEGGHAICIVGYEDDSDRPGGGGFIFRNSWGGKWAPNHDFERGHGTIPYEYINEYCVDACTIFAVSIK